MGWGGKPGKARPELLGLGLILAAGAALRLYGLDWDGGHWLHPDERQIYFVVAGLDWPRSLAQALSPDSPLNPHFFAYGSLSIYLLKIASVLLAPLGPSLRDPNNLHLIGRPLATLLDLGTVYFTYRLGRGYGREGQMSGGAVLVAAALVSLAVLHIQIAHFYATDPLLALLVMITLNLGLDVARGERTGPAAAAGLGVGLGLALATKLSAAPLVLVPLVAQGGSGERRQGWARAGLSLVVALVVFFIVQPYALIDWPTFVGDSLREAGIARGALEAPYTQQYAGTLPFVYSAWQTALWGLALPLGLVAWAGLGALLIRWLRQGGRRDGLVLAWAGLYFGVSGVLYARPLRYMLPLVPILCVLAVGLVGGLGRRRVRTVGLGLLVAASLAYALAFSRVYAGPHPWVAASAWIYGRAEAGGTLAVEHWDTPLPLPLEVDGQVRQIGEYDLRTLALYDEPDDEAKWAKIAADLAESDYIVVASRRLYGSIPRSPERYPLAAGYHARLFGGELGFVLVGEFTRGPSWLNPRVPPLPGAAPAPLRPDEGFVVYDHPRALILENVERLPAEELLLRLSQPKGEAP